MTWRCTCCYEIYEDNEVCPTWETEKAERAEARIAELEDRIEALELVLAFQVGGRDKLTELTVKLAASGEVANTDKGES